MGINRVVKGYYVDEDGVAIDIATIAEKGFYAIEDVGSTFPSIFICLNDSGLVHGEYSLYHDLFEVKLVLNGFRMRHYDGQDGLFFKKVVKHEKGGHVRFDIVEYCSLQTDVNSKAAEHRGKLQIAYGHPYEPDDEFDEAEIMRTGEIGDLEDYRSMIDPESDEGRELLKYAGIDDNAYDGQKWGEWMCPECDETNSSPESQLEGICEHCKTAVLLSGIDEWSERKATKNEKQVNKMDNILDNIELIKKDLAFQITFEEIDWDYFIDTAMRAKELTKMYLREKEQSATLSE